MRDRMTTEERPNVTISLVIEEASTLAEYRASDPDLDPSSSPSSTSCSRAAGSRSTRSEPRAPAAGSRLEWTCH